MICAKEQFDALIFAIGAVENMHGSVTGDAGHIACDARTCECAYGKAVRILAAMCADIKATR